MESDNLWLNITLHSKHTTDPNAASWNGKDIFRDGVWCIKDENTEAYKALRLKAQTDVVWAEQNKYTLYMVYLFVVIIFCFILKRIAFTLNDKSNKLSKDRSNTGKKFLYYWSAVARSVSYRRFPSLLCNIFQLPSSLGNFLIISACLLFILCSMFIPTELYRACIGFGTPPLAIRCGVASCSLIPFVIVLSGKTNLISQLTGISYEKLNVYHRWAATASCLLAWIHTVPFYYQQVREGGIERLHYFMKLKPLYWNGIPALVFLTVLTVFSHSYIRSLWYELWINVHWICTLGFFISIFIHVNIWLGAYKYLAAAIVFWATQMIWRGLSKNFLKPNRGFMRSNPCTMKRLTSTEREHFFEIDIQNIYDFTWSPGQHIFLRIPGLRFLETHPFSIMSYYEPMGNQNSMKLIVKAAGLYGMTSLLYNRLPEEGYKETTVFVDGPYGGAERESSSFNNIYLMATGTGVTAVLPFLLECIDNFHSKTSLVKFVRLDWIIRTSENVEWITPELTKVIKQAGDLIANGSICINIYVTEEMSVSNNEHIEELLQVRSAPSFSDEEKKSIEEESTTKIINVLNAKPDTKVLIEEDIASTLGLKNMFIVSGSDSLRVSVSNSLARLQTHVLRSPDVDEIYLHSEVFGW